MFPVSERKKILLLTFCRSDLLLGKLQKKSIRKFEDVYKALKGAGFCCMTIVDCDGTGRYSDHEEDHISAKYPFADAYRVIKLEILVADEHVQKLIEIIRENGRTGYQGDGMII